MDTEKIKQVSRTRYNHRVAKLALQEKHTARLQVFTQGGFWHITPFLIATLATSELGDTPVLLDSSDQPRRVNRLEMLANFKDIYEAVSNVK